VARAWTESQRRVRQAQASLLYAHLGIAMAAFVASALEAVVAFPVGTIHGPTWQTANQLTDRDHVHVRTRRSPRPGPGWGSRWRMLLWPLQRPWRCCTGTIDVRRTLSVFIRYTPKAR
jgi:hypothetical protein